MRKNVSFPCLRLCYSLGLVSIIFQLLSMVLLFKSVENMLIFQDINLLKPALRYSKGDIVIGNSSLHPPETKNQLCSVWITGI